MPLLTMIAAQGVFSPPTNSVKKRTLLGEEIEEARQNARDTTECCKTYDSAANATHG